MTASSFRSVHLDEIERAIAVRNVLLWIVLRLALTPFLMLAGQNPAALHPQAALIVVLIVGALARVDLRRRHDDLFLANLGTSRLITACLCLLPAFAGEVLLGVLL